MKFANLLNTDGVPMPVLIDAERERYWPLSASPWNFDGSFEQLIPLSESVKQSAPEGNGFSLEGAVFLPPFKPSRNVFCVGKNYQEHAAEFSQSGFDQASTAGEITPTFPVIFTKAPETLIGNQASIPLHSAITSQIDYEAELGVIIGKGGRNIARADAYAHVWGYTIINDITARDLQKNHRQWFLGKSLDGFCPIGPWVVTADEFDPSDAFIRCWVNIELRQDANVNSLIFDIPSLIECLSAGIELRPGDIISTGTPAGVGIGFNPAKFLQPGDRIRIEIEGIGVLENTVGHA
jgi:2-keto-4-pentenoate hydratase/2-oxohepta-3-ene-1,7-dioic acid hydratase in catechol pathway